VSYQFSARLPNGQVRPFEHAIVFNAYVEGWPDAEYSKIWPTPYCCLIQAKVAPF